MALNNPGPASGISSISLTGNGLSSPPIVFLCSNKSSCAQIQASQPFEAPLAAGAVSHFDTNTTTFYFSEAITSGQTYNYVIRFANGQSVSGSIVSEPSQSLPAGPSLNYSNTATSSSYYYSSSTCTMSPYTAQTINTSSSFYATIVTIYSY
ncbi:MAG: hypothetical protein ACREBQ_10000 [Nitrososphaerales archaeon]